MEIKEKRTGRTLQGKLVFEEEFREAIITRRTKTTGRIYGWKRLVRDYRGDELSPGGIVYFSKNRRRYYAGVRRRLIGVTARWLGKKKGEEKEKKGGWSGERAAEVRMYGNWRFITAATSRPRFCSPQKLALARWGRGETTLKTFDEDKNGEKGIACRDSCRSDRLFFLLPLRSPCLPGRGTRLAPPPPSLVPFFPPQHRNYFVITRSLCGAEGRRERREAWNYG